MKDFSLRTQLFAYVRKKYGTRPEYLWKKYPDYAVLRHAENTRWYGIVMGVSRRQLGRGGGDAEDADSGTTDERLDILNVKVDDPVLHDVLLRQRGFYPAWHMNKGTWISVQLDGTVPADEIRSLVDGSYAATLSDREARKIRGPKNWLIPANVRYADPRHFFDRGNVITWTQSSRVQPGDILYIYAGVPIGAILYRCEAVETDLPADESYRERFSSGLMMRLRLLCRYPEDLFTREKMREEYGIGGVRGPRYATARLAGDLEAASLQKSVRDDGGRKDERGESEKGNN